MKIDKQYFKGYKKESVQLFKDILQTYGQKVFDEQALPAYTNPNPLMQYLFWLRVKYTMQYILDLQDCNECLDFGCGLGVMIPFLVNESKSIIALDLDTNLLEKIGEEKKWTNVQYSNNLDHLHSQAGKIDLILAMDVLEHIDNLDAVLQSFNELLSPNGSILVTGPTENFLYKIGRRLANYSGEYHKRNIHSIAAQLGDLFTINRYKTLFPIFDFLRSILQRNRFRLYFQGFHLPFFVFRR
jgi:2-polyprenyl-3-methyl-5-hydroxy-6-metoxy-1,4-benzoquinol methylase